MGGSQLNAVVAPKGQNAVHRWRKRERDTHSLLVCGSMPPHPKGKFAVTNSIFGLVGWLVGLDWLCLHAVIVYLCGSVWRIRKKCINARRKRKVNACISSVGWARLSACLQSIITLSS